MKNYSTKIGLHNLRPAPGSNKLRKRVGRGIGSGGRTCGRGNSGQKSRSGPGIPKGFEGGQTPFYLKIPKSNLRDSNTKEFSKIRLDKIQWLIDTGRIDTSKPITLHSLRRAGIKFNEDGVMITSAGYKLFKSKVVMEMTCFEAEAINRIEKLGGLAAAVYHEKKDVLFMRRLNNSKISESLLMPPMKLKERIFYSSWEERGYLNPIIREKLKILDPNFEKRYRMANPISEIKKPHFCMKGIPNELRREGLLHA